MDEVGLMSRIRHASVTFACIYRGTTIAASAKDPVPTSVPVPATISSVIERTLESYVPAYPCFVALLSGSLGLYLAVQEKEQ